jgi:hypothetical protein
MKTIMKISSGREYVEVVKVDRNYILQTQRGSVLVKRGEFDEEGVRLMAETINELTEDYGWKEINL